MIIPFFMNSFRIKKENHREINSRQMNNDETHIYKVSDRRQLRMLAGPLVFVSIYLICLVIALVLNPDRVNFAICAGAFFLLIITGPAFYLHYSYFMKSRFQELHLHENYIEILEENKLKYTIHKKDVQGIELFAAPGYMDGGIGRGMIGKYNYMEIKTADFTVQINNLLFPDLRWLTQNFFDISPVHHIRAFAQY